MKVCREQTQILQGVSLGTAPEQQELCRDGAMSLARLAGLSAPLQGHTALAAAGGEQGRVLRACWTASHKPPGPTDPPSLGILLLTLLQKLHDERITTFPRNRHRVPRRCDGPTVPASLEL